MFILIPIRGFAEAAASRRLINSATKLALARLSLRIKAEQAGYLSLQPGKLRPTACCTYRKKTHVCLKRRCLLVD